MGFQQTRGLVYQIVVFKHKTLKPLAGFFTHMKVKMLIISQIFFNNFKGSSILHVES